jgi:hypothetical protein
VADRAPSTIRPAGDEVAPTDASAGIRVGRRLLAVLVVVGLIVASGWWLTQTGVRATTASVTGPPTGAWFCPHGGGKGWQAWVAIANPGPATSTVRVTPFDQSGSRKASTFTVAGSRQVLTPVPASSMSASTEVEFFGGWVAVNAVVQQKDGGLAAERCVSAPQPTWLVSDSATGQGEDSYLVVMNPFGVNAEFDVVFRTENRAIRPGPLSPGVVKPGRSLAIHVNSYALAGPGEQTVTAEVRPLLGRVVAGGVGVEGTALRAEAGQPVAAGRLAIPATGYAGTSRLYLANVGGHDATAAVLQVGPNGSRSVSGVGTGPLSAERAETVSESGFADAGSVVTAKEAQLSAALRLESTGSDQATISAVAEPAAEWIVPAALPPSGGTEELALLNPGRKPVDVEIEPFGQSGPVGSPTTVTVPAGRTLTFSLSIFGTEPLSSRITASGGTIVVGLASTTTGGSGFAATAGVPRNEESAQG